MLITMLLLLNVAATQTTVWPETVLYTKELTNGAKVSYVRIHPMSQSDESMGDIWRYVLRYKAPGKPEVLVMSMFGPDGDIPSDQVLEGERQFIDIASDGKLLAAAYNEGEFSRLAAWRIDKQGKWELISFPFPVFPAGDDATGSQGPPAHKAEISFEEDGSISATLHFHDGLKAFLLRPERFRTTPDYPYPDAIKADFFESPWKQQSGKHDIQH